MTIEANTGLADDAVRKTGGSVTPRRLIAQVEVSLEAFLGDSRLTVAELTALAPGSSVVLDQPLNGAVELRLNGAAIARGELVAAGDRFAVRLTEIAE